MTTCEAFLIVAVPVGVAADLVLCHLRTPGYFRSILPVVRRRIARPAHLTPVETWLDDADASRRGRWAALAFARLSDTEVGFWEPWRTAFLVVPVFIAGRIVETSTGEVQLVAGPRWIVPILWTWALCSPGPGVDTPLLLMLAAAIFGVYGLHQLRVASLAASLRQGAKG